MMGGTLWTRDEVVLAVSGTPGDRLARFEATGISIDSRTVQPGDLFIALAGPNHDGHGYVADALTKGAVAAIVHADVKADAAKLIRVDDTLRALWALGRASRARTQARVTAITGSAGKTGTRLMVETLLRDLGAVHASPGSFNNHWGVPLTLARAPWDVDHIVLEMGMNHAGELRGLTMLARPHTALITNTGRAHIENLGSERAIALAKAEILQGLEPDGTAILPGDSRFYPLLRDAARMHSTLVFGEEQDTDIRLLGLALEPERTVVDAIIMDHRISYAIGAVGKHWAMNSLAALACVVAAEGSVLRACGQLATVHEPEGRGAVQEAAWDGGTITLIDEAYNANPDSMAAALAVLSARGRAANTRTLAILGDMRELGPGGPAMHADLTTDIRNQAIDGVITVGPLMAHLALALPGDVHLGHAKGVAEALDLARAHIQPGHVVMVKASNGMGLRAVVEALRDPAPAAQQAERG